MSDELKCNVLLYGPEGEVAAFTRVFARDRFQAHLPIPADAAPRTPCEPAYESRRLAEEHWGTRFIYARPGVTTHSGPSPIIDSELGTTQQQRFEGYQPPLPDDAIALITFTVPTDPPALWADHVIRNLYQRGLRFMFRWWDMENYHRCVYCGALDGICLRAGAFWSTEADNHSTHWYGETRCSCSGEGSPRVTAREGADDSMVSMTAFVDGPAIRVVSTFRTGRRSMLRLAVEPDTADDRLAQQVQEINAINHALDPPPGSMGQE